MIYGYLEEYIPNLEEYYEAGYASFRSLANGIKNFSRPLIVSSLLFYNTLDLKSDSGFERTPVTKDHITKNLSDNLENMLNNDVDLKPVVDYIGFLYDGEYSDNEFYKSIRMNEAKRQISLYNPKSDVIVIDKTFQKALFFKKEGQEYTLTGEYDCGTAKVYGKKVRPGDGKTPEGIFNIYSIEPAHNKLWDGEKAYGAYFLRILGSIGVHGNGTDTVKTPNWRTDKTYMDPDPLGVYDENFAFGPSHGCVRLDNKIVREKVESGEIKEGTQVVIYENKEMTKILRDVY